MNHYRVSYNFCSCKCPKRVVSHMNHLISSLYWMPYGQKGSRKTLNFLLFLFSMAWWIPDNISEPSMTKPLHSGLQILSNVSWCWERSRMKWWIGTWVSRELLSQDIPTWYERWVNPFRYASKGKRLLAFRSIIARGLLDMPGSTGFLSTTRQCIPVGLPTKMLIFAV